MNEKFVKRMKAMMMRRAKKGDADAIKSAFALELISCIRAGVDVFSVIEEFANEAVWDALKGPPNKISRDEKGRIASFNGLPVRRDVCGRVVSIG